MVPGGAKALPRDCLQWLRVLILAPHGWEGKYGKREKSDIMRFENRLTEIPRQEGRGRGFSGYLAPPTPLRHCFRPQSRHPAVTGNTSVGYPVF